MMNNICKGCLLWLLASVSNITNVVSQVKTYGAPVTETSSKDYKVKAQGKEVFIYNARVSAYPINVWPGINRPLEQTELASFGYFDINGETNILIEKLNDTIHDVIIRPLSLKIKPLIKGNTISFKITKPCQISVEVNGFHKALTLFANPIEKITVKKSSPNVLFFGRGIHYPGVINAKNNQTIYIAGGAVVHGIIYAHKIKNLKIIGRGILDASTFVREVDLLTIVQLEQCQNVSVQGIILRDAHIWTLLAHECNKIDIDNIKIIGQWRYNADGIDIVNTKNVTIQNSFVRAFDDCIVVKGIKNFYWGKGNPDWDSTTQSSPSNVVVRNCIIWNDWNCALEIGAETVTDSITNVLYQNCDIIHYVHVAMDIQNGNRANISNITYDNIRIEEPISEDVYYDDIDNPIKDLEEVRKTPGKRYKYKPDEVGRLIQINIKDNGWQKDKSLGSVTNVYFRKINYTSSYKPTLFFEGYSAQHKISNIYFDDIIINNRSIQTLSGANITVNEFVENIKFNACK